MIERSAIPRELVDAPRWVLWRAEQRNGRSTKVPYSATNPERRASSTDPATWAAFDDAAAALPFSDCSGVGFTLGDGIVGVDLDGALDAAGGPTPQTARLLAALPATYTEVSPSGRGLHLFLRGRLPSRGGIKRTGLEVYEAGRYFTFTGRRFGDSPLTLADGTEALASLYRQLGADRAEPRDREAALAEGQRNDGLFRAACAMRREGLGREEILSALQQINNRRCRPPLADDELAEVARSATRYEPTETSSVQPAPRRQKFIARRVAEDLAAETPVATGGGLLHVWRDGHYRAGEADIRKRITERLGDDWRRNRADDVVAYLRDSAPALWQAPPLDRINVANGILELSTGDLAPHDPEFLSPVQIAACYDPNAGCLALESFFDSTLAAELEPVVYELVGYLVTPDQSLQTAVMLLGEGANGKSTLLRVIVELLGSANVSAVALHRLDEDRFAPAELYGKLANVFADLDSRALHASSMFKAITGGDAITGERKYAAPFVFQPYARLLYSANEPPPTPDSSDAFFRRWLILPFDRTFRGAKADRRIVEKLTTPGELSGLLNRGLAALPELRRRGCFRPAKATADAAERFRLDSDSVSGFLADRCELDPDAHTPRPRLFPAYRTWCSENNRRPLSKQRFNRRVEALHPELTIVAIGGTRCWSGIRLGAES